MTGPAWWKDQDRDLFQPLGRRDKQVLEPRREIKQHVCPGLFHFP